MSVDLYVLAQGSSLPAHDVWQRAIAACGFDVTLDTFEWASISGFFPVRLRGRETGFELSLSTPEPEITRGAAQGSRFDAQVTFHFGGDMDECVAAFCAASALASCTGGVVFDPQSDEVMDAEAAIKNARDALASV